MKTEELINKLSHSLRPQSRRDLWRDYVKWIAVTFLVIAIGVFLMGLRKDLSDTLFKEWFQYESFFLLTFGLLCAWVALRAGRPEQKFGPLAYSFLILGIVGWIAFLVRAFKGESFDFAAAAPGWSCFMAVILFSMIPGIILVRKLRKMAPTSLGQTGLWAATSVGILSALGVSLICSDSNAEHLLLWHFVPVLVISILGFILGRFVLKW
ncbi:MAG: NrsF family protein [Bacteriovoracia bacterium]